MAKDTKNTGQAVPDGYFENLENQILAKTIGIETWHIQGTKNVESCFPVPEGYWLRQEEGIRNRIRKPETPTWYSRPGTLLAPVLAGLLLLVGIGIFLYQPKNENWEAKVETLNHEELIAYISDEEYGLMLTEQVATSVLEKQDLPETELKINESELEKELEQLDENELPHLTEIGYED